MNGSRAKYSSSKSEDKLTSYREEWPLSSRPVWMTIGNFDGFHRGHAALVEKLKIEAKAHAAESVILTFWPHPRVYLQKLKTPFYLSTKAEKKLELSNTGVDQVASLLFNGDLASLYAEGFFAELSRHVNLQGLVVGNNFAIGKDRSGSMDVIKRICERKSILLSIIEATTHNGLAISSGRIRKALISGNIELATEMLGKPYTVTGKVHEGKQLGTKLGFPTANLTPDTMKILPKWGVYATFATFNGDTKMGATSVGVRPTFEETKIPNVETLVLDFDGNIYDRDLKVAFVSRLRDEIKYINREDLISQINLDAEQVRRILTNEPTP
jgi:riboflavin kinase/FMN adenylyltransferase